MAMALCLLATLGVLLLAFLQVRGYLARVRGIENGLDPRLAAPLQPRLGVNVALEQYTDDTALARALQAIRKAGFRTVRQRFAWAELEPSPGVYRWGRWDHILALAQAQGLQVIAVLDTSPAWARPAWEADNPWAPPENVADYARFVGVFAERYGAHVLAYQVWDQPNIAPHWGQGEISPAGYVRMLRAASEAIRAADPDALIIAGGLAPNLEAGGRNMSEVAFLREIYRRGAGVYFDVLGAKPYGFWTGPEDRRVDARVLNYSRLILLREEMRRRGEAHKPIWALEGGWCALEADWRGRPAPQGSDAPFIQNERLHAAIQRSLREWPWLGLLCLPQWQPNAPPDDPVWGYALVGPTGQPHPLLEQLHSRWLSQAVLYPGSAPEVQGYLLTGQEARTCVPQQVDRDASDVRLAELRFWGTELILQLEQGPDAGELWVGISPQSPKVIAWGASAPHHVEKRIARGLGARLHALCLRGTPQNLAALRGARVGHCPPQDALWLSLIGVLLALALGGTGIWHWGCRLPWQRAWGWLRARWGRLPPALQTGACALSFLAMAMLPSAMLRLGIALVYGACALLQPDVALYMAVACIPLAPIHVRLGPGSFSVAEVSVLVAAAARLWNALLARERDRQDLQDMNSRNVRNDRVAHLHSAYSCSFSKHIVSFWARWTLLDGCALALVLLGLGTSLVAEYRREALREWRVVVVGSALLYALVRTAPRDRAMLARLMDVLWVAGVGVALLALVIYPSPSGVIEAEGVRRARAFYGSPNNLALVLERILPLGLAVAVWGRMRWRRWVYGLGAIPIGLATLLTFSRGAWFLGVPAAILALAWMRGGRWRWIATGAVLVGALALIPLAGPQRIASLLDPSRGTTLLRLSLWHSAWEMVCDHPWLGVGLDNFLYYYGDYIRAGAEVDRWLSHPHNMVLDFWLRLGVGGIAILAGLLVGFVRTIKRASRTLLLNRGNPETVSTSRRDLEAMTLGIVGGIAAMLAHGCIDSAYFVVELALWFMFALAWVERVAKGEAIL